MTSYLSQYTSIFILSQAARNINIQKRVLFRRQNWFLFRCLLTVLPARYDVLLAVHNLTVNERHNDRVWKLSTDDNCSNLKRIHIYVNVNIITYANITSAVVAAVVVIVVSMADVSLVVCSPYVEAIIWFSARRGARLRCIINPLVEFGVRLIDRLLATFMA